MSGDGGNHATLAAEIVALSDGSSWDVAKLEWRLKHVYWVEGSSVCLCGHTPINEICVLENVRNGNVAEVGNVCVTKFMGINSESMFACLRRVRKNKDKAINVAVATYAYEHGWLSAWERDFCVNTVNLRSLSAKQLAKRREINASVIRKVTMGRTANGQV